MGRENSQRSLVWLLLAVPLLYIVVAALVIAAVLVLRSDKPAAAELPAGAALCGLCSDRIWTEPAGMVAAQSVPPMHRYLRRSE